MQDFQQHATTAGSALMLTEESRNALLERRRQLAGQLRAARNLSEPCPPGRWRWADVRPGGYGRKSDAELASDRERNRCLAQKLEQRIAQLNTDLKRLADKAVEPR